jgi:UDP-glucose 4-epimerase
MKTVLVTGVTGFIGRYVARLFTNLGWSVVGIGTSSTENSPLESIYKYYTLTLPSPKLFELIQKIRPHVCIHCAGRASVPLSVTYPSEDFNASVASTFNILEALRIHAPECRLIYLSSAAVYGNPEALPIQENYSLNPISPYGFHKSMCEELCKEYFKVYGIQSAITRIFSAYGPGLRRQVVWDICYKVLTLPEVSLQGTGQESRDFIHVKDVARAIYFLSESSTCEAEIFNLGSGNETTILSLSELVIKKLNKSTLIHFDGNVPAGNPINWRADVERLKNLGFVPEVSLDQGIDVYARWCQAEVIGW